MCVRNYCTEINGINGIISMQVTGESNSVISIVSLRHVSYLNFTNYEVKFKFIVNSVCWILYIKYEDENLGAGTLACRLNFI